MAVTLHPYDARWPAEFDQLAEALRVALGNDAQVTHIGSTAVPGLLAKPIIDMQLGVAELARFEPERLVTARALSLSR